MFLLSHMLPAQPRLRRAFVASLGERAHLAAYSFTLVLALAWLIAAAGRLGRGAVSCMTQATGRWRPAAAGLNPIGLGASMPLPKEARRRFMAIERARCGAGARGSLAGRQMPRVSEASRPARNLKIDDGSPLRYAEKREL